MPHDPLTLLSSWRWRCGDCGGTLLWARDNFQGRRLLAILLHEAEATAEEMMAQGTLRFIADLSSQGVDWLCCCGDHGPVLSAGALAARQQEDGCP